MAKHADARSADLITLLNDLHQKKIVNLDSSLRDLLDPQALGRLQRGDPIAEAIVYSSCHYVLIYRSDTTANIAEVDVLASAIRQALSSQKA
jgi:hypothetical protein